MTTERLALGHTPDEACNSRAHYHRRQIDACKELRGVAGPWLHIFTAAWGCSSAASLASARDACKLQDVMKAEV
jgi:hypothetical protein